MDVPKEKIQSGHLGVTDLALNEMSRSPSTEETDPSTLSKHVQTPESSQEPIFASAWPPCHVCPNPLLLSAILDDRRRYSFPSFESWLPYFKDSWVDKELLASRPSLFRERAEDEPARKEEHNKYMKILLGDEEELSPAIPGTDCFNPVLERFWLSWAR